MPARGPFKSLASNGAVLLIGTVAVLAVLTRLVRYGQACAVTMSFERLRGVVTYQVAAFAQLDYETARMRRSVGNTSLSDAARQAGWWITAEE